MAADSADGFGTRLRRLRERAGLTQEALAERAGISAKAVSALERGERRHPYPHTVRALAAALELSASERALLEAGTRRRGQPASLPVPASALLGREDDVKSVAGLLVSPGVRLVTLTGPGGVGKTRLALEAARELAPRFKDGAALVSFAAVFAPHLVLPTLAHGLGVRGSADRPLKEVVEGFVRSRSLLLVLDNLEHLLEFAPQVSALLAAAPRLRVLATSRSPLRLQGEHVYPMRPLTSPWAVELFEDRSRRVEAGHGPGDEQAVLEICPRLDCLPLAIELAAAQTRVLPARALLGRLDSAFRILVSGPRDLPERQQALRRTIDWSHDLLTTAERALFRRVAEIGRAHG